MKVCTICKTEKPLSDFNKKKSSDDGRQNVCRDCNRERSRRYYADNKEKHLAATKARSRKIKETNREFLRQYLQQHPCVDCGHTDTRVLEFDHLPGEDKFAGVAYMINFGYKMSRILEEMEKCEVVCRNCHHIRTLIRSNSWNARHAPVA